MGIDLPCWMGVQADGGPSSSLSALAAEAKAGAQGAAQAAMDASDRGESAQNIIGALANKEAITVLSHTHICWHPRAHLASSCGL